MIRVDAWQQAKWLATAWVEQYGERNKPLAEALKALGPNPSPDEVDQAFSTAGRDGASNRVNREFNCDECHEIKDAVVRFNEGDGSYNSFTDNLDVCGLCLLKALQLLDP